MDEQAIKDMNFLLSFAPATCPSEVAPGLFAACYLTGTYEGDVKVAERVKEIVDRHGLTVAHDEEADNV